MAYKCFSVEVVDHIAHMQMIRPEKANSMIPEFWGELPTIVNELSAGTNARVIVLSSNGRHFSSGMDLSVFGNGIGEDASGDADSTTSPNADSTTSPNADSTTSPNADSTTNSGAAFTSRARAATRETILRLQQTFTCLEQSRLPVIAAIQGACIGGGIDMVSACDMRYGTTDAFFSIQEINIGMTADVGTLQRLPRLVGEGIVRDLAFTGRRMDAAEAAHHGLLNAVFDDADSMMEAANKAAAEIASKSPMAVWGTKQVLNYSRDHSITDGLEYIATWNAGMLDFDDMSEAFKAQMNNRPGEYPDNKALRYKLGM